MSVLLAICGAYAALTLAERMAASVGRGRAAWLGAAAGALGVGIWSMHFVGMLAAELPGPPRYDVPLLAWSALVAVAASGLGLAAAGRPSGGARALLAAGACVGLAICGMHYMGMAALSAPAHHIAHERTGVALSVLVAVAAATAALWLARRATRGPGLGPALVAPAVVMGVAVAAVHYVAMAAVRVVPGGAGPSAGAQAALTPHDLATAVALVAALLFVLALVSVVVHRRMSARRFAELAAREAYVRALVEHAGDGILVLAGDGTVRYASPPVERAFGCAPGDVLGTPDRGLVHAEDLRRVRAALAALAAAPPREGRALTVRARALDGTWRHVEAVASRMGGEDAIIVNLRDVTVRTETESLVRASEERFRALSASSPVGILQSDAAGDLTYVNARAEQILGAPASALRGRGWVARVHADDVAALVDAWTSAREAGREFEHEYRLAGTGDAARHVRIRSAPLHGPGGALVGRVGTLEDVSERRRVEAALARSEERLRLALDSTEDGLWDARLDTGEVYYSPRWCQMLGFEPAEVEPDGRAWERAVHPDDWPAVHAALEAHLRGETPTYAHEFRMRRKDGGWAWILSRGKVTARAADGRALRLVGAHTDITGRREAEEALRASERFNHVLLDSSPDCVKLLDLDGRLQFMNGPGRCLMEVDDFCLIAGAEWAAGWPSETRALAHAAVREARAGGTARFAGYCPTAGGTPKWWDVTVTPVHDASGAIVRLLSVSRDVTASKEAEGRIRESEARFRALSAASPAGIFHADRRGDVTYANARSQQIWAADEGELLGRGWLARVHPADRAAFAARWDATVATGVEGAQEFRLLLPDGSTRHVHGRAAPLRDAAGAVTSVVGTLEDVTEQRQAERALAASEARYRTLVDDLHEVVFRTDAGGRWTFLNRAWTELTGLPVQESLGAAFSELAHPEHRSAGRQAFGSLADGRADECRYEALWVIDAGPGRAPAAAGARWVEVHARAVRGAAGELLAVSGTIADVTGRKAAEERLRHEALHDPLTGLANRVCFGDHVERALALAGEGVDRVAVLFVDLDGFKGVNDRHGHAAGDNLLRDAAARLLDATRGSDTVARLGGDEFAILVANAKDAAGLATLAQRVVRTLAVPFRLVSGEQVQIGASVGVASGRAHATFASLVADADAAMYEAKRGGRSRFVLSTPGTSALALVR